MPGRSLAPARPFVADEHFRNAAQRRKPSPEPPALPAGRPRAGVVGVSGFDFLSWLRLLCVLDFRVFIDLYLHLCSSGDGMAPAADGHSKQHLHSSRVATDGLRAALWLHLLLDTPSIPTAVLEDAPMAAGAPLARARIGAGRGVARRFHGTRPNTSAG